MPSKSLKSSNPPLNSILVISTRYIGDALLITPLLRSLRCAYPQAHLAVLLMQGCSSILHGNPDINHIIELPPQATLRQQWACLRPHMRHYDMAFSTLTSDKAIAYAFLTGRQRVALVPPPRWQDCWKRILCHGWTELTDGSVHRVLQHLRLVDLLGIPRCYDIVPPQVANAEAQLQPLLPFALTQPFAVLHLTPLRRYKRWTQQGWAELAHALRAQGWQVVLTGGKDMAELAYLQETLVAMPIDVVNLAGKLSLPLVAELLQRAHIYIGPDTAVTHLAAATGIPTVALYGPTNPSQWSPFPAGYAQDANPFAARGSQRVNNVFLLQGEGDCVPCHREGCDNHRDSDSQCLQNLPVQRVLDAISNLTSVTWTI